MHVLVTDVAEGQRCSQYQLLWVWENWNIFSHMWDVKWGQETGPRFPQRERRRPKRHGRTLKEPKRTGQRQVAFALDQNVGDKRASEGYVHFRWEWPPPGSRAVPTSLPTLRRPAGTHWGCYMGSATQRKEGWRNQEQSGHSDELWKRLSFST